LRFLLTKLHDFVFNVKTVHSEQWYSPCPNYYNKFHSADIWGHAHVTNVAINQT